MSKLSNLWSDFKRKCMGLLKSEPVDPDFIAETELEGTIAFLKKKVAEQSDKRCLIILQGLPGSGKSTLARVLVKEVFNGDANIHSTDDLRVAKYGSYKFVPEDNNVLHSLNFANAAATLLISRQSAIIDNTNIRAWEARPYVELAWQHGIHIAFIRVTDQHQSVHNVPEDTYNRMAREMEELTVASVMASEKPIEVPYVD